MLLHTLIATHRDDLLRRSRARRQGGPSPEASAAELDPWLPVLLDRLAETLESEEGAGPSAGPGGTASLEPLPPASDATLQHQMRRLGITLERVWQDCEELRHAVTEMAYEDRCSLSAPQVHALDRSVARVIADAREAWAGLRERVVVVEPDRHVRKLVQTFVGGPYLVEFHDDGSSALDRVRCETPALLITEILVPRLDGLALCRSIKTDPAIAHVPILVYSVLAAEYRAKQSGADAFLEKPLEKRRLVASVHELISRGGGPQPQEQAAE